MTLIRDVYRAEILGGRAAAGEEVLHVFLELDADVLRQRLNARVVYAPDPKVDQRAREFCLSWVDAAVDAAARQPDGTLMLRSTGSPRPSWPTRCWPGSNCARFTETVSGCGMQHRWTQKIPRVYRTSSDADPSHIK